MKPSIKEDTFIKALILEGKFDKSLLVRLNELRDAVELSEVKFLYSELFLP